MSGCKTRISFFEVIAIKVNGRRWVGVSAVWRRRRRRRREKEKERKEETERLHNHMSSTGYEILSHDPESRQMTNG